MMTTFNEYQLEVKKSGFSLKSFIKLHPDLPIEVLEILAVAYDGLGLGEAGEVQGKIKKIIRDNGGIITDEARLAIKDELGDTLWYITSMCSNLNITLEEVAEYNIEKFKSRRSRGTLRGSGDNR